MSTQHPTVIAAHALLSELSKLLPPEEATEYDHKVRKLLAQIESDEAQPTQLMALLRKSKAIRQWLQEHESDPMRSLQSPAGNPTDLPPDGDKPFVGMPDDPTPPPQN